ncbi:MAG: tandem-95 repeat protein, partial [Sulfitobacter sp.]|nr:tandem-95 repeat protein [Sulfitobacter sp.]
MLPHGPQAVASHEEAVTIFPDGNGQWKTPEDFALFTAEFVRDDQDLLLEALDGAVLRLPGFFLGDTPADIFSHDGGRLAGHVVERLAGPLFPGQYAQSGGLNLADPIGQVETLEGAAFVQRIDGTTETLDIGGYVFQGDVVRTGDGSTLGITFIDGTIFTLASGSRMVLDELIYDPDSTDNKGVFDLVEGSFVFIAGQAASSGGIDISTPAATMGIRGTTISIDIQSDNGIASVNVRLATDANGLTGQIQLFDLAGNEIALITETDVVWTILPPPEGSTEQEVTTREAEFADDALLIQQAFDALSSALGRVAQGQNFVQPPAGTIQDGTQIPDGVDPTDDGTQPDGEPGTDDTELNGEDDPVLEGDSPPSDDDALLDNGSIPTDSASNGSGAPQFAVTAIQSTEDTPITGSLGVTDNSGGEVEVTLQRGALNGQVILLRDGTFTYTPNENFDGTDNFVVLATGSDGDTSESEITVIVDPVNDAPVVTAALSSGSTNEIGLTVDSDGGPAQGTLGYDDVDEAGIPATWSIAPAPETTAPLGTISINPETGAWQYTVDQTAADPLAEGQEVTETYIATVRDAEGATATSVVSVTIVGSNDGPVITSGADQATLAEDIKGFATGEAASPFPSAVSDNSAGTVTGQFLFEDVDQQDAPGEWSVAPSADNTTMFGEMVIDPLTGEWIYTLDQAAADVLGNDDTAVEVFTATVTDAFGATASQTVTITITGFNDAPTIEFSIEDIEATVLEEGYEPPEEGPAGAAASRLAAFDADGADASGTLSYTDPDGQPGDTATWAVTPLVASLGSMSIDPVSGHWHYFLDEGAAQSLGEGEEQIETFTATVTDALGQASSQVITITVVGSNDESEIIALPADLEGAVAEGGTQTATGTLSFVDPDAAPDEVATWSIRPDGEDNKGTMTIDPGTGQWLYTLDETLANDIGENQTITETYSAVLTDALGAEAIQTITIDITGENDAPMVTGGVTTGTVEEAGVAGPGAPSISGTITATDPDLDGTNPTWGIAADPGNATALGQMTIDGAGGTWTYVLNQSAADYLQTGDSITETFEATITDFFGETDTVDVVVTIEGANDAPVLSATTGSLLEETVQFSVDLATLASDVDAGEDGTTLTYEILNAPALGSAEIVGTSLVFEPGSDFAGLVQDEEAEVVLQVSATDARGASDTSTVTLTIVGTNGPPTLASATREIAEGTAQIDIELVPLGDDPDAFEDGSTLIYTITGAPGSGSAEINGTTLSFFSGSDFDDLAEGEEREVGIEVTAADSAGETAVATMFVTVTGRNGAPLISASSDLEGTVTEPGTPNVGPAESVSGDMIYADLDATTPISGVWSILPATSALGAMAINDQTGRWTYTLNETAAEKLNAGEVREEIFTATVTDEENATDFRQITITIRGTNDDPILSGDSRELSEDDPSVSFNLGSLVSDADAGDQPGDMEFAILSGPGAGRATLSGSTLTFFTDGDFDDLAEGAERIVTLQIRVTDPAGGTDTASMSVTVTGENDAPVIRDTSIITGTVIEPVGTDGPPVTVSGTLGYDDPDAATPMSGTWDINPLASPLGDVSIDQSSGQWTYVLDKAEADSLNAGETRTETFVAKITDAQGASDTETVTITIEGTNDAPTLETDSGTLTEDYPSTTFNLAALADDVDTGDTNATLTFRVLQQPDDGRAVVSGSTLTFFTDGDFDDLAEDEERAVEIEVEVRDTAGATDTATLSVLVTGLNDPPEILASSQLSGGITEPVDPPATPVTATGLLAYTDPDGATPTSGDWSIVPTNPLPGFGSMQINPVTGRWTYTLDAEKAEGLNAGEVRTETFIATITDEEGATDTEVVTITITGTNDAPQLSADSRVMSEDTESTSFNLALLASDVDAGDDIGDLDFAILTPPDFGRAELSGTTLTFFTDSDFDDLADDENRIVTIEVEVRDPADAVGTATLTVTVGGDNDGPVITSDPEDAMGTAKEEGEGPVFPAALGLTLNATGQLTYFDPDEMAPDALGTWTVEPVGEVLGVVEIDPQTGEWEYYLDEALANSLREGEEATDTFTATITDVKDAFATQTITINIIGTNDAPVFDVEVSEVAGSHTEGGEITLDGQLTADDPDKFVTAPTWSIELKNGGEAFFGSMEIDQNGKWTYTVDPDTVATLGEEEQEQEVFTATVRDEFGQEDNIDVTITVEGTNTAPVISADEGEATGTVKEDGFEEPGMLAVSGQLMVEDVDAGETTGEWSILPSESEETVYGTMSIDPETGEWTFELDPVAANGLSDGSEVPLIRTFQAIYTDADGAVSEPITLTVTIEGTNDAPVVTADTYTAPEDGNTLLGNVLTNDSDPEGDNFLRGSISDPSPAFDGSWGLTVLAGGQATLNAGTAFQYLADGETAQATVLYDAVDVFGARSDTA